METEAKNDYAQEIQKLRESYLVKKTVDAVKTKRVLQVGLLATAGAGAGVLVGVAGSIAAASILEAVIPSLLITKTAGVVGGAAGMLKGISKDNQVTQ